MSAPYSEDRIFPIALVGAAAVVACAVGLLYWYVAPQKPDVEAQKRDFEAVYIQLGIQPLPPAIEAISQIKTRLEQLSREACYGDAVIGLAEALLDAGYPRESAN